MPKLVGEDLDPKFVKKVSCHECARFVEYVPMEVTWKTYSDYGGGSSTDGHILCPNCKKTILVGSR